MNVQLSRDIFAFRAKLVPLINEMQILRKKSREYEQQQQQAKKMHNNVESSMNVSINDLQSEIERIRVKIEKDVEEIEKLQEFVRRMKATEERLNRDTENSTVSDPGKKLKEELNSIVLSEEAKIKSLVIEKDRLKEFIAEKEKQIQMWNDILSILKCKIKSAEDIKQSNGIVVRRGGAETLVLQ